MEMQHSNWIAQARAHWKEHLPKMFARLERDGNLEQALTESAEATSQAIRARMAQGATWEEAWEATRELYLFPPEETGQAQKMPRSQGYRAHVELTQALSSLGQPED